jgi:hypothetical protein
MTYRVLKPIYEKTGEATYGPDGKAIHWHRITWQEIGTATSMKDAQDKYGGYPVLEREHKH